MVLQESQERTAIISMILVSMEILLTHGLEKIGGDMVKICLL